MTVRVSVIIPYFNSAWSIDRTVRSIHAQTFKDFEIILIDDGSQEALPPKIAADARIRLVRQPNRGLAGARNRGVAESTGEFVAPLDADDLWHPDFLREMTAALDSAPAAPFAFCHSYRIDEQDQLLEELRLSATPDTNFLGLLSLNSVGCGSAAVFRRADVLAAGGYDETLRARAAQGAEDWKLILQLAARSPPVLVRRTLCAYRLTRSGMSQAAPERQLLAVDTVVRDLRQDLPTVPVRYSRDARTMMRAWLLPAYLRQGRYGAALWVAIRAYIGNPLWWRNRNLRLVHVARLKMALRSLMAPRAHPIPVAQAIEAGIKPFAFLDDDSASADQDNAGQPARGHRLAS